jgi:multidrug efflux pump subunit AcrA (membrane-fusion protein)
MKKILAVVMGLGMLGLASCSERAKNAAGDKDKVPAATAKADASAASFGADQQKLIGLETAVVAKSVLETGRELPGEILPDPSRTVRVNGPVAGWVRALNAPLGSRLEAGAVVAVLENPENLGRRYDVRAPAGGIVTRREVNVGEWIESGKEIVEIVDYGTLFGVVRAYPDEMPRIALGQAVEFTCGDLTVRGTISYLSPVVSPETRTVEIRAEIPNPSGRLKANAYARAKIILGTTTVLACPQAALIPEESHAVAFVKRGDAFEKRTVETGLKQNGLVEVRSGLAEGEIVVTKGAYQLKNLGFRAKGEID